ncbi:hypothetical protein [Novosphingobium sp. CECT 9465]|jgi:hypothetical protein|uniref:hypothetical protein n=1 Tax=Novosphingobium sp. CECT 9465 TaxID=2829794 RepID=UPI001E2E9A24|nr:hypothetical protein [Novosphingobium sp. CECT 9465]CAH0498217.1 hypothetical protein NVSP9465_03297 [Novosphingobium sp. CECT 9465]
MTEAKNVALPAGFEDLAEFAPTWGQCFTQDERNRVRVQSTMAELQHFYNVVQPRLDAIFVHLDAFPLGQLPEPEDLLNRIVLSLTEVSLAVEIFGQPQVPGAPAAHPMRIRWQGLPAKA